MKNPRIVILGAGPTGLGAAYRFQELGHRNWLLLEKHAYAGGLASSITDEKGFTWDLGGHVQFSHYPYFDTVMDKLILPGEWLYHERESWIWIKERFVPYPFQFNLHRLPREDMERCLAGVINIKQSPRRGAKPIKENFGHWITETFGEGIASLFMRPYNFKVWAYPPEELNTAWLGERVAPLDVQRIKQNIKRQSDDVSWGPNSTFRFPKRGGTGAIWRSCVSKLNQSQIRYNMEASAVNTGEKRLVLQDGSDVEYDFLLNTMPLDGFLRMSDLPEMADMAGKLLYSSTHIFGVGLKGQPPVNLQGKCWMYFPESNCPFYRVTVFSNYSPHNVPDGGNYWSLMAEVSESPMKAAGRNPEGLLEDVIQGMLNTGLINARDSIINTWQTRLEYGYPTPSLTRDEILSNLLPRLDVLGIGSRGRFGAWKYEVSNQDHSFMQGVEWADKILSGTPEMTVWNPNLVNARPT